MEESRNGLRNALRDESMTESRAESRAGSIAGGEVWVEGRGTLCALFKLRGEPRPGHVPVSGEASRRVPSGFRFHDQQVRHAVERRLAARVRQNR